MHVINTILDMIQSLSSISFKSFKQKPLFRLRSDGTVILSNALHLILPELDIAKEYAWICDEPDAWPYTAKESWGGST